ncbi:MAG: putative LPS assembly protein LptD [Bacteroidia bacterium]
MVLLAGLFLHSSLQAQQPTPDSLISPPIDSLNLVGDTIVETILLDSLGNPIGDSLSMMVFSADTNQLTVSQAYVDSLKATSDLQAAVPYKAVDSIVFDVKSGRLFMYGSGELTYTDIELKAERITVAIDSQTLFANGIKDSLDNEIGYPLFTMAGSQYEADQLAYNFKTSKGRVKGGRTVQGEGFILTEIAKYQEDGSIYGAGGKYTTCDDPNHPHYYIRSSKLKLTNNNQIISGPLNLVIGDLPLPVIIPFAFIPTPPEGKVSGILQPNYGNAQDRGYFLRGLGYYKAINEYFDVQVDGDIYTRGGWRAGVSSSYRIQHSFSGNLRFQYGVQKFNQKGDPDFKKTAAWSVNWSHNQPINPNTRLSSSVNISSSNSFQREISYDRQDFFTNDLNSSINFQKTFANTPFSMNLGLRHQQDLNDGLMSMSLPEMTLNMNRQNPFKNLQGKNLGFLKQFGVSYNMSARNRVQNLPDSLFLPVLINPADSVWTTVVESGDTLATRVIGSSFYKNGMEHRAAASTQIKLFNYLNISPSFNYREIWLTETVEQFYNEETNSVESLPLRGFARGFDYSTSVSATTNFYGIYGLTKSRKEIVIRQRFTPNVNYNLRPDFADSQYDFYRTVQTDTLGNTRTYSRFQGGTYTGPGQGESQAIGFGLSSVLEMKYRTKESFDPEFDESKDKFERIRIIDNLGISGNYNFAADSFRLSTFSMRARTSLFKNKVSINASGTLDPYKIQSFTDLETGVITKRKIDEYMINTDGRLGRITRAQISFSTSLRGEELRRKKVDSDQVDEAEYQQIQRTSYQYVDFDIPWDVRLRYSLSYTNSGLAEPRVVSTMNVDGSLNISENWKLQVSSGFDLVDREVTNTSLQIFRNLHCWDMSFRWVPFGPQRSYSFVLNVRSSTLQALRLTKNNYWQDRFQ